MKSFKSLLVCTLSVLLLFSCSKHDDSSPSGNVITGSWKVTSISYTGTSETNVNGMDIKTDFVGAGEDLNLTLAFSENPNVYTANGSYHIVLHLNLEGQDIPFDFPDLTFVDGGTWSVSGKKVTITNQAGATSTATVQQVDAHTVIMLFNFSTTQVENGIPVKLNFKGSYTLEK